MGDAKSFITRVNAIYRGLFHALTVGVRGAIIDEHTRVFLVRHTYVRGWHLPGGGVEVGEATQEALRRELREEAGVELTGPPVLHGIFFNSNASRRDHVVVYVVRAFSVMEPKQPDAEIAGAAFFPLTELPADIAPSTRARLHEIVTGERPAATW
jgi:ADP-ribose pyrophosphatase YjhB (NUDIX family)